MVADAAAIASTPGDYLIQIDSEQMLVTNVNHSTNTLTVVRGYNGTPVSGHASGAGLFIYLDQIGYAINTATTTPSTGAAQYEGTAPGTPSVASVSPTAGPSFGTVTLTGTNLENAAAVTFGGLPGTIVSDMATQIVVVSPLQAPGDANATVWTAGGYASANSAAAVFTFTGLAPESPAFFTFDAATNEADLTIPAGETVTVAPKPLQDGVFITSSAGFYGSTATTLTLPSTTATLNVYLANDPNYPDTLTLGGWGSSTNITDLNVGANPAPDGLPPTPETPVVTDQNDSVTLNPLSTTTLNVSADTLQLKGGGTTPASYSGWAFIESTDTPGESYLLTSTISGIFGPSGPAWPAGFSPDENITISDPKLPEDDGTYTISSVSGDALYLKPGPPPIFGFLPEFVEVTVDPPTVEASDTADLTAVNGLDLLTTGVPYEGAVTINAAPSQGQPFAGDPYLTGPDWGTYFYAQNQDISFIDASGNAQFGTIAAVVGDRLYLTSLSVATESIATGIVSDEIVECASFFPQLYAGNRLTLNVTGPGNSIFGAMDVIGKTSVVEQPQLNATTNNGNITIEDVDLGSEPLSLGTLNAGTAQIQLDAVGSIVSGYGLSAATGVFNLVAGAANLMTTGTNSSIGDADGDNLILSTDIGELTATTNDGGVYISNGASALTIDSVVADQDGQAPFVDDDQILYNKLAHSVRRQLTSPARVTSRSPALDPSCLTPLAPPVLSRSAVSTSWRAMPSRKPSSPRT